MDETLQNEINRFRDRSVKTDRFQINKKNFSDEIISNQSISPSIFKNSSLSNLNFTNVDLGFSFFQECLFQNCIFDSRSFQEAEFKNCNMINCQIKDCNLGKSDFAETTFDKCCFERVKQGSLVKGWFESCHFIETNFNDFEGIPLIQTAIVDSKFSKFNKSIEFKGEFFLRDILYSESGINPMFIE